jgi:multidrug resistance efflux pump
VRLEQTLAQQSLDALHRNALLTASQAEKNLFDAQLLYENVSSGWNINRDSASEMELTLDDYIQAEKDARNARSILNSLLNKEESNLERIDAQDDLNREQKTLSRIYADLLEAVAQHDQLLDEEQTMLLSAIAALEIARESHNRLDENNLDPEKLSVAEARLEAAATHLAAIEDALANIELRAPFAGMVLSLDKLSVGDAVAPDNPIVFLADTSRWIVETKDLSEVDIARVALGDIAVIKLDAFPGEEFFAKVTVIDPVGRDYLGDITYKVSLTLNETDERFMWNMTATVIITPK